jgi:tyrosinase
VSLDPTLVTTAVGTVTPGPGEAVQVSTLPNGEVVTQIVTIVVTVTAGAEPLESSADGPRPSTTQMEVSTPVTTPVGTVTPGVGEKVEVVTLENGRRVTRVVTVVQEVTVYLPAPTA